MTQGPEELREEVPNLATDDATEEVYPSIVVTKKDELAAGHQAAEKLLQQMRED